jgi:uncharacterized protein (TIGR03435 family)
MTRTGKLALLIAAAILAALPLSSQTSPPKLSFEVVSIKPIASGYPCGSVGGIVRGDRLPIRCSTLRMLLQRAYQPLSITPIAPIQIIGGPSWIDSDRWDIEAKFDCDGGALSSSQIQEMVRSMLEDRFRLKAHKETREGQVYSLVVVKAPAKIKLSDDQTPIPRQVASFLPACSPVQQAPANPAPTVLPTGQSGDPFDRKNPAPVPRGFVVISFSTSEIILRGSAVPIARMVGSLQRYFASPIIDKTNLPGLFDFTIQFSHAGLVNFDGMPFSIPIEAADPVPTLFTAIQELGLKLEPDKGPLEVLVVDSVQKPTKN